MVHHHHWKNELCQSKKEIQINSECYWGTEGKTRSSWLGQRYRKDRNQHSIRCSGTLTNWLRFVKPCLVTLQILPLEAWVLFLSMQLAVANGMWAERPCASSSLGLSSHLRFHGAFLLCFCLLIVMRGKMASSVEEEEDRSMEQMWKHAQPRSARTQPTHRCTSQSKLQLFKAPGF